MTEDDKRKLQEAQRHLADAQRAIDGANVHIRSVLANASGQTASDGGNHDGK